MEYTEGHSPKTGIVMIELLNKIRSQLIRKTFNRKYDYNNKTQQYAGFGRVTKHPVLGVLRKRNKNRS
ncbi:hypothetical protein IX315_001121 [Porphyromonas levii]|nr:hypothetical protein [Porphyromonas levii]MBR8759878.1 hypothetical protein [Porphyromonas levii]